MKMSKCIWSKGDIEIREWSGRLIMVKNGIEMAELIGGQEVLKKNYKGDYEYWIAKIKAKDLAKATKMREEADTILAQCDELGALWRDNG